MTHSIVNIKNPHLLHFATSSYDNFLNYFQPDVFNAEYTDFKFDNDGNLLVCGEFYQHLNYGSFSANVVSGLNFFLFKYDPVLDSVLWLVNSTGSSSLARSLSIDNENNAYVTGSYNDGSYFIDTLVNAGGGNHNFFVIKIDENGTKQWLNTIDGGSEVHGYAVASDDSNNVFVLGEFEDIINVQGTLHQSEGMLDPIVVKYNSNGNLQWSQSFGGTDSDEGYDLVLDSNQDIILLVEAGVDPTYNQELMTTSGWNEPLLVKINNTDAELIWYKRLPSTLGSGIVNATSIAIENNNIAITGINRTSILMNGNEYLADNNKDFYSAILSDSLTYALNMREFVDDNAISIYPNPASDYVNLKTQEEIKSIKIFSLNGNLILNKKSFNQEDILSTNNIPSGTYLIQIETNKQSYNRKIQILH